MMEFFFSDEVKTYDGSQLKSHFALEKFGIIGDSCVAFVGSCDVPVENMVDLEDVAKNAPIYSPKMLHFILEDFSLDLRGGVLLQRLMVSSLLEILRKMRVEEGERRGDDLYWGEQKLNVSIATRSPVSTLIHLGVNVDTKGTPVPTIGLSHWEIDPKEFGRAYLENLKTEMDSMGKATCKVRPVD